MLELRKVYAWDVISKTYPDMYAIITDEVRKDGFYHTQDWDYVLDDLLNMD